MTHTKDNITLWGIQKENGVIFCIGKEPFTEDEQVLFLQPDERVVKLSAHIMEEE